ncbi:MAG: prepilin-type N-terminal cleavage/methylation domain-containing protein [Planctomycetota bacterium]
MRREGRTRSGWTLLELLAVLAVLALLFAFVAPALTAGRRSAQCSICMSTLRQMGVGAETYAKNFEEWVIGSPAGSGNYLIGQPAAYGPAVQTWDFMGPMAWQWRLGLTLPSYGDVPGVLNRFNELRGHRAFSCAANDFLAGPYGAVDAGVGPMVSYNMPRFFLYEYSPTASGVQYYNNMHEEKIPLDWSPRVTRVGNAAGKVLMADGARYSTVVEPPDYDLSANSAFGGAFADVAPYSTYTRSWDRSRAPGNGHVGPVDARMYAFRHSLTDPPVGAPANVYRMNLLFYDGHVETQGDLEASNPHQWLPSGSRLETSACYPDTREHFGLSGVLTIGG